MKMLTESVAAIMIAAAMIFNMSRPVRSAEEEISYILIEAGTGTVLDSKNAGEERFCGYLAKLMSLLVIADGIETGKFSESDILSASHSVSETKGSVIWLEPGDRLPASELLKGAVIGNANDALTVLAEKTEQSIDKFTSEMNSRAFDMGLRNTRFTSPYGFYGEGEYSSASDIAEICAELSRYGFMEKYFSAWRDFVKDGSVELVNENTLARTFDGHIGFKASHSEESGYCIAEGARDENGTVYIAVVLGAPDEETSFSEAKRLIRKGFSEFRTTVPGFPDELLMPVKVMNGVDSAVEIRLSSQNQLVVPKAAKELSNKVVIPEFISAPVKKGQKIGTVGFYCGDTLVCETAIVAEKNVDRLSYSYILRKMLLKVIKK